DQVTQQVPDPLVGGEEVVHPPVVGVRDAYLLGAVRPVQQPVPGAQALEVAQVVGVHLPGAPGHRLREPERVGGAGAQVVVPEPQVGGQLRVVPRVPAHVVAPHVPVAVVGVHHVAVVPESVPGPLVHLVQVVGVDGAQPVFPDL